MKKVELLIRMRDDCKDLPLPRYMSEHASGMDLCAAVPDPAQADADADGEGDAYDNCVQVPNDLQLDQDRDGQGNDCDN